MTEQVHNGAATPNAVLSRPPLNALCDHSAWKAPSRRVPAVAKACFGQGAHLRGAG